MGVRRFAYIIILAGTAFFYTLYPFWFAWYLFLIVLLILPFDFLISLPGMLTRHLTLSSPQILERGANGVAVLITHQKKHYPARCVKVKVMVSGDDFIATRRFTFGADSGSRYEILIDSSRTGLTIFQVSRFWTISAVGLFCLPTKNPLKSFVLVLPPPEKPPFTLTLPKGIILRPKPGGGFSEDYDLRQYRLGDPIKSVHWKVSAKYDSLIIREPLIPPPHSRLLHAAQWSNAQERDLILGRLRWISDYLLKWELAYFIRLGEDGPIAEISNNDDLLTYLYFVLGGTPEQLPYQAAVPVRFGWVFRVDASV